jgi:hypothetical protein
MKTTLRTVAIAAATLVCTTLFSLGWTNSADARARLYVSPRYAVHAVYFASPDLPWYAVRAYYFNGPWSGPGYSYNGWSDYASRNGIACVPGTAVKGGDGILYICQ